MNFFSREIVFLFSNDRSELEEFFDFGINSSSGSNIFPDVPTNILASINIEIPGKYCNNLNSFVFKYEGDQVIPYMDMVNTLTKIADFHGLHARFDSRFKHEMFPFPSVISAMVRQFVGHLGSTHNFLLR